MTGPTQDFERFVLDEWDRVMAEAPVSKTEMAAGWAAFWDVVRPAIDDLTTNMVGANASAEETEAQREELFDWVSNKINTLIAEVGDDLERSDLDGTDFVN